MFISGLQTYLYKSGESVRSVKDSYWYARLIALLGENSSQNMTLNFVVWGRWRVDSGEVPTAILHSLSMAAY